MILNHFGKHFSPQEIERLVPQTKDTDGNDAGTITQQLASWATTQGFDASLYTFDCQIIDQSWAELSKQEIIDRLKASMNGWVVPGLGENWSRAYRQSYIDYLETGSELHIQPAATSSLFYQLLNRGPIFASVCINTLYGRGKSLNDKADDINGRTWNHSLVIYGNDSEGKLLVADPLVEPGFHTIEPERMIAAIATAQIECDNFIFQILPN